MNDTTPSGPDRTRLRLERGTHDFGEWVVLTEDFVDSYDALFAKLAEYKVRLIPENEAEIRAATSESTYFQLEGWAEHPDSYPGAPMRAASRVWIGYEIQRLDVPTVAEKLAVAQGMFAAAAENPDVDFGFVDDLHDYLHGKGQQPS